MRANANDKLEKYRVRQGEMSSDPSYGCNGAFMIPYGSGIILGVIVSDGSDWKESGLSGEPWEHVSVSLPRRCPYWDEMCFVKDLWWRDDELVIQFHVPVTAHINCHNYCLHLWRPCDSVIPLPPSVCV